MKKWLIGLGCSWTQGEGGYPEHIWKEYNGRVNLRNVPDDHLRPYEHENSWVNVLCKDYLTDYTPLNLGVRGIGNRAAIKQAYLTDAVDWDNDEGIIVYMLSGLERFDFFTQHIGAHNKFYTMWPHIHTPEKPLWRIYLEELYSDKMSCMETLANIKEAEMLAKATGFKLVVANAFHWEHLPSHMERNIGPEYTNKINWDNFMHTDPEHPNFLVDLIRLDGVLEEHKIGSYWTTYQEMKWPQKYLTNCIHPNIDGYKYMAKELYEFINVKNYV